MNSGLQDPILKVDNLHKEYADSNIINTVLHKINLQLCACESLAIIGRSGSGKSTLLHLLGGLDTITSGKIEWFGQSLEGMSDNELSKFRNTTLGFVYQFHHLLPEFTVLENVLMPIKIKNNINSQTHKNIRELLVELGLEKLMNRKITDISGGEKQRVAIARAMANYPKVILTDEPTGNLDEENSHVVTEMLVNMQKKFKTSLIVVTHDLQIAKTLDRCLVLTDGTLVVK